MIGQEQYAAVLAALGQAAAAARSAGDPRTRGQVKADTLVARGTGVDEHVPRPVTVELVVGTETLFGDGTEPGLVPGVGHLPAALCRDGVFRASRAGRARLRRLFVTPQERELVAMESRALRFDGLLGQFIELRDGDVCRTPWCDQPIAHHDHVVPAAEGGPTSASNGQGLCESCNYVKEAPGWTSWTGPPGEVGTMTPLGDVHITRPPAMPGGPYGATVTKGVELDLADLLLLSA